MGQCQLASGAVNFTWLRMGIDLQDSQPTEVNQMLLATVLLLFPLPQAANVAKTLVAEHAIVSAGATKDSSLSRPLPSMPAPKVATDADASATSAIGSVTANATIATEAIEPRIVPMPIQPVKPAYTRIGETPAQRKLWYALAITGHSAAGFDAWSTRRAVSQHYGSEANPLLRPFSHSRTLYAAMQVSPAVMDYIGKRMMVSQNRWVRKMWWLPQAAGTGISISAGVHNMNLVP